MYIIIVAIDQTCKEEIIYSETTFYKRKAHKSVGACIFVPRLFLVICGGNIYAESKKVKAFIESLSLNRNYSDTPHK